MQTAPVPATDPAAPPRIEPTEAQLDEAFAIERQPGWPATRAEVMDHPTRGRLVRLVAKVIAVEGATGLGRPVTRPEVQRPEPEGAPAEPDAAPYVPPACRTRPTPAAKPARPSVALPEPRQPDLYDRKRAAAGDLDD